MADISLDEGKVKELLKQAVLEVLEERRDLIYDVLAEVMEDFALARAIQEGAKNKRQWGSSLTLENEVILPKKRMQSKALNRA